MTHKLEYSLQGSFQNEIFLPLIAVENNFELFKLPDRIVEFSTGERAKIMEKREIHLLSPEGQEISQRLYGCNSYSLLKMWYMKIGRGFDSLYFVYLKLKKE